MSATIKRIDLAVESIRQAENFYTSLFRIPVAYREAVADGRTTRLAPEVTWEEAQMQGLKPERSVLGCPEFQIALCGTPAEFAHRSRLEQVALSVDKAEMTRLARAAADLGCDLGHAVEGRLIFRDPYGISWEAAASRNGHTADSESAT